MCLALLSRMFVCLGWGFCEKHLYHCDRQTAESSFLCYRLLGNWIGPPEKCYPMPSLRTSLWHTLEGSGGGVESRRLHGSELRFAYHVHIMSSILRDSAHSNRVYLAHHGKCINVPSRTSWTSQKEKKKSLLGRSHQKSKWYSLMLTYWDWNQMGIEQWFSNLDAY